MITVSDWLLPLGKSHRALVVTVEDSRSQSGTVFLAGKLPFNAPRRGRLTAFNRNKRLQVNTGAVDIAL